MKSICLISGGIDSPLAAYLISKKTEIIPLHFCLFKFYCEESFSLAMRTLNVLEEKTKFKKIIIYPWEKILKNIFTELDNTSYACVLCRKAMFKTAEILCDEMNIGSITTGESLGQKASQTLDNLASTSYRIKYPIYRPLIGLDKEEIIKRAKEIGLYFKIHTSCCNTTPQNPKTKTKPEKVEKIFKELGLKEKIMKAKENIYLEDMKAKNINEIMYSVLKENIQHFQ